MIDPRDLALITSAVTLVGNEYLKGVAGDAGKATWVKIKALLGWAADPTSEEIPQKVSAALTADPAKKEPLLSLLGSVPALAASVLVGEIHAPDSKIIVAGSIVTVHM